MSSIKCPNCGLVLWASAQTCKRCNQPISLNYPQTPQHYQQLFPPQHQPVFQQPNAQLFYQPQPQQPFVNQQTQYEPQQATNDYDNNQPQTHSTYQEQPRNFQSTYGSTNQTQETFAPNYSADYQQSNQQNFYPNYNQPNFNYNAPYQQGFAPNYRQQPFGLSQYAQQKKGMATASMIIGIVSVVLCGLFGVVPLTGSILGFLGYNKAKKEPQQYGGETMAIVGIALNALGIVVFAIFLVKVSGTMSSNFTQAYSAANESSAISSMRTLHGAEMTYQATQGRGQFGTLQQLGSANLIDSKLTSGTKNGYQFTINVQQKTCEIFATPINNTSARSFYLSCHEGVVRAAQNDGLPASASDPPVDSRIKRESFDNENY